MALAKLELDHAGIEQLLKSGPFAQLVESAAGRIADTVRSQLPAGTDIIVDAYTTDRAAASVTIRDVRGRIWQVRDGVLTRAAAANGYEVTAK